MAETFQVIAGPCTVESQEQIEEIAAFLKSCGMKWIKGGGWKPLTWGPKHRKDYHQSLGYDGTRLLGLTARRHDLKSLSEWPWNVGSSIDAGLQMPDRIQVGARNQQSFCLLEEIEFWGLPVLIKRHFGCSLEELYASTTYLPNCDVWVCERGVRAFDPHGRFLLDLQAIAEWKYKHPDIKIFTDVSHWMGVEKAKEGSGIKYELISKAAKAAKVMGADGILVDVHPRPEEAWVDPYQSLTFREFQRLLEELEKIPC